MISVHSVQVGKGGTIAQVKAKDVIDGTKFDFRVRSSETVEQVIVSKKPRVVSFCCENIHMNW